MKFSWGKGIILAYALFIAGVAVMITISVSKDVDLVAPDYYEKEIKYQEEIDRINNTSKLQNDVSINLDSGLLIINYPDISSNKDINGEIIFYRPSDSGKDFRLNAEPGTDFKQVVDIAAIVNGLWKIKIFWSANGVNYLSTHSFIKQ